MTVAGAGFAPPDGIELVPEAVTGWRLWRLRRGPEGLELHSLFKGGAWPARAPLRARCERSPLMGRDPHPAPEAGCACGIYAASSFARLLAANVGSGSSIGVVGTVSMWGRVVEHAGGYRAELGYPSRLRLICAGCMAVGRDTVPEVVLEMGGLVIPACRAHAGVAGARPGSRSPSEVQAELLGRYAVDLLPLEALHRSAWSRLPRPVQRLAVQARKEARALARSWVGWLGGLALLFFLWSGCRGPTAPVPTGAAPDRAGAPSWAAMLPDSGDPPRLRAAVRSRSSPPLLAMVCGDLEGAVVTHAPRCRPGASLFGFADSPPSGRRECELDGYTRKRRFSVCWLSVDGPVDPYPHAAIWRMPGVHYEDVFG